MSLPVLYVKVCMFHCEGSGKVAGGLPLLVLEFVIIFKQAKIQVDQTTTTGNGGKQANAVFICLISISFLSFRFPKIVGFSVSESCAG